ncbi:MAG TPA: hypothetical protein VLM40_07810 [Gemmata sp.]|nr:hypothetical protein [Gemmata sp.]
MMPMFVLACCFFLVLAVPLFLFVFTSVFRHSCVLCGLPKPSVATAAGVLLLMRVSTTISEAILNVIVMESCRVAGLPRWEAGIIVFFLLLPVDLLISAGLHAGLMNIKFGKGIEVWFMQMLIYLGIAIIAGVIGLIIFLGMK